MAKRKPIVVTFGRFNPPTIGHEESIRYAVKVAKENKADLAIVASKSQDKKKNPLSFERKIYWLIKMFPEYKKFFETDPTLKTPIAILKHYNQLGYQKLIYIAGSDRVKEFDILFHKYNGKDYNYSSIDVRSSGERKEGVSASDVRKAVTDDDYTTFEKLVSNKLNAIEKQELYTELKSILG